jgi:nucleotide-binding universal stress UspA family protein
MAADLLVLVGFDDSPAGRAALSAGADLAARLGAAVRVVHAVAPVMPLSAAPAGMPGHGVVVPPPEEAEAVRGRVEQELGPRVAALLHGVAVPWTFEAVPGDAVTVLEHEAESSGAYLVVVGTRHAGLGTALDRLLTGSTSRGLQRRATRPVLVVPEPHGH